MAISGLIALGLRVLQAIFGVVILGLSVTLIRGHHWGDLPASLGYAVFLGGITIVAALIGIAATWVTFLEGIVGMALDGLVAVLNIVGGIVRLSPDTTSLLYLLMSFAQIFAVKLKGVSCKWDAFDSDNNLKLAANELFNGGIWHFDGEDYVWVGQQYENDPEKLLDVVVGHCRESQADLVFMFMTAVLLIITALMLFLKKRKGY
jgi:hypothetical protein